MPLQKLTIAGFRGFSSPAAVSFALPNGDRGSGLTVITGSNNSGKSAVIESLRARNGYGSPSFTTGVRNTVLDYVQIDYEIGGQHERLESIGQGSSETKRSDRRQDFEIFVLQSRRAFNAFFGKGNAERREYLEQQGLPTSRSSSLDGFTSRLFKIQAAPAQFNKILERALGFSTQWTIDCSDQGSYFLKFKRGSHSHTSDGLGEGIVSVFSIVDALYDSSPGNMIVIDEPELSLHPSLQKRVANLLAEYSADRQIVISTHSPYFIDISTLAAGSHIVRVKTDETNGSTVHELSPQSKADLVKLSKDRNNPHLVGTNAKELFFQEDGIILTEGQEDVVLLPHIFSQVDAVINGSFFGWGVGGAEKMTKIAAVLNDLGFMKVVGILDGDKSNLLVPLSEAFPNYNFISIPAKDIRTKPARDATPEVQGLVDKTGVIIPAFTDEVRSLAEQINSWLA